MKKGYSIIFLLMIAIFGCSKTNTESPTSSSKDDLNLPISGSRCRILATFSDTVTQVHAENFLQSKNVTIYILSDFNQVPPHWAVIPITDTQTSSLIDTLINYPEIKSVKLYCLWL
jgi:hypothetical protein